MTRFTVWSLYSAGQLAFVATGWSTWRDLGRHALTAGVVLWLHWISED